jgi:DNA-binding NarL/FixJ family response regulator
MPNSPIHVAIVEDHGMVADALAASLSAQPDIEVVVTANDVRDVELFLMDHGRVDAVLLDLRLGDGIDGLSLVPRLRRELPGVKILVLSAWSDDHSIRRALEAGCDGYLLKEQSIADLVSGLRAVVKDERAFAPRVTRQFLDLVYAKGRSAEQLTATEIEVLQHIARGHSSADIARSMFISVNTVRNHAQHILNKMDVRSRGAAVAAGARAGIIQL